MKQTSKDLHKFEKLGFSDLIICVFLALVQMHVCANIKVLG